jgi:hypothetical protein
MAYECLSFYSSARPDEGTAEFLWLLEIASLPQAPILVTLNQDFEHPDQEENHPSSLLEQRPELPIIHCTGFSQTITPETAKNLRQQFVLAKTHPSPDLAVTLPDLLSSSPTP